MRWLAQGAHVDRTFKALLLSFVLHYRYSFLNLPMGRVSYEPPELTSVFTAGCITCLPKIDMFPILRGRWVWKPGPSCL